MAFQIDPSDELGTISDINVTPLVDVMLVLLVIFMVTAPMLTQGLTVELPAAEGKNFDASSSSPSTVMITANGAVYLDGSPLGSEIELTLGSSLRSRRVKRALLEADEKVPYGRLVKVMDIMNRAGVEQLGMVTRPVESGDARRRR